MPYSIRHAICPSESSTESFSKFDYIPPTCLWQSRRIHKELKPSKMARLRAFRSLFAESASFPLKASSMPLQSSPSLPLILNKLNDHLNRLGRPVDE